MSSSTCIHCGGVIRAQGLEPGWRVRCPDCGRMFVYQPTAGEAAAPIVPVIDYLKSDARPRPGGPGVWSQLRRAVDGQITAALIGLNLSMFAVQAMAGADVRSPSSEDLIRLGALYGPEVARGGWHRLMLAGFLHIGVFHLMVNMWSLYVVGRELERNIGSMRFLSVYLVSILTGSVCALFFTPGSVVAGASGGVFGITGALLVFVRMNRHSLPADAVRDLTRWTVMILGINLAYGVFSGAGADGGPGGGMMSHSISNAGHLGGLVGGVAIALLVSRGSRRLRPKLTIAQWAGCAAVLAATVGAAAAMRPQLTALAEIDAFIDELDPLYREYLEIWERMSAAERLPDSTGDRAASMELARTVLLPKLTARVVEPTQAIRPPAQAEFVFAAWNELLAAEIAYARMLAGLDVGSAGTMVRLTEARTRFDEAYFKLFAKLRTGRLRYGSDS